MVESFLFAALITTSTANILDSSGETHKPYIIVDQCLMEFPILPSNYYATIAILSFCHLSDKARWLMWQKDTVIVKPLSRFSSHSYIIKFNNVINPHDADIFVHLYEKLFITSPQLDLFEYIGTNYRELNGYHPWEVKRELLRGRWNLDEFVAHNSLAALNVLRYNENQLPTFLQKQDHRYKTNNVSDLDLRYYITSGYRQTCTHQSWYIKLASLTYDFTAYDRLFCDAIEYHGLQHSFQQYWNLDDMYYLRGRLLRDGLVSYFPPDTSNVVYYACPKLTFVVLQRPPTSWYFVVRPFSQSLWLFVLVTFITLECTRHLKNILDHFHECRIQRVLIKRHLFALILHKDENKLKEIEKRHLNALLIFNGAFRIMLSSAYSGMILVGILQPFYPWTPDTFEQLNITQNYFVGIGKHSQNYILENLVNRHKLNRVSPNMFQNRNRMTPADFLEYSESKEYTERTENHDRFYAAIMYDDKMNMWTKGRVFIYQTAPFLERITAASDKVLSEIRYLSVAPGATRLHFLVVTLKRAFTSGTWMRWYHLEQNYYKNVAPILAVKKVNDRGLAKSVDEHERRSLNFIDLFSLFVITCFGLGLGFLLSMFELYTKCAHSQNIS